MFEFNTFFFTQQYMKVWIESRIFRRIYLFYQLNYILIFKHNNSYFDNSVSTLSKLWFNRMRHYFDFLTFFFCLNFGWCSIFSKQTKIKPASKFCVAIFTQKFTCVDPTLLWLPLIYIINKGKSRILFI